MLLCWSHHEALHDASVLAPRYGEKGSSYKDHRNRVPSSTFKDKTPFFGRLPRLPIISVYEGPVTIRTFKKMLLVLRSGSPYLGHLGPYTGPTA